jgi:hypothetical protein
MDNSNETPTPEPTQNPAEILPDKSKLSKLDMAILTLAKANPQASAYQIGKQLLKAGVSTNRLSVYHRLKKNDYLNAEFKRLEVYNREQLVREDFPLARKKLRNVLKSKDNSVPAAVQVQAAKIIYDKALADRQDKHPESPVIIENIERLQVLIQGDVSQVDT